MTTMSFADSVAMKISSISCSKRHYMCARKLIIMPLFSKIRMNERTNNFGFWSTNNFALSYLLKDKLLTSDQGFTIHSGHVPVCTHDSTCLGGVPGHSVKFNMLMFPPSIVSTQWTRRVRNPRPQVLEHGAHSLMYHLERNRQFWV